MGPGREQVFAALVILGISGLVICRTIFWVMASRRTPDPWPPEVDEALRQEEAVPLCHHCLTPQQHNGWFCPQCGATVGPYCNYLPYVYLFSQGEVLRAGITERLRHSPLIIIGYIVVSLGLFAFVSPLWLCLPVYWFLFGKNLQRRSEAEHEAPPLLS